MTADERYVGVSRISCMQSKSSKLAFREIHVPAECTGHSISVLKTCTRMLFKTWKREIVPATRQTRVQLPLWRRMYSWRNDVIGCVVKEKMDSIMLQHLV